MTVVPMEERHLDTLAEIEKVCFHAPWSADMLREELGKGFFLVAEQDGAAVGYVGGQTVLDEAISQMLRCRPPAGGRVSAARWSERSPHTREVRGCRS